MDMYNVNQGMDEETLLEAFPIRLKRDVMKQLNLPTLASMPIFADASDGMLTSICEVLRVEPCEFATRTYVCRSIKIDCSRLLPFCSRSQHGISCLFGRRSGAATAGFPGDYVIRKGEIGEEMFFVKVRSRILRSFFVSVPIAEPLWDGDAAWHL